MTKFYCVKHQLKHGQKYPSCHPVGDSTYKKIYPYVCQKCGQSRETRIHKRLVVGICMKCKRVKVVDGQVSLFGLFRRKKDK